MLSKTTNDTVETATKVLYDPEYSDTKVIDPSIIATVENTATDVKEAEDTPLSEEERVLLSTLENHVGEAFQRAALALLEINQKRLYRETHKTFEEYCIERFSFSKRYTYYYIDAGTFIDNYHKSERTVHFLPSSEYQVRPLSRFKEPEKKIEAWERAVEKAGGKVPSFSIVSEAVAELSDGDKKKLKKKELSEIREGDVCVIRSCNGDERLKTRVGEIAIVSQVKSDNEVAISLYDTEDFNADIAVLTPIKQNFVKEKYKLLNRLRYLASSYENSPQVANVLFRYFATHLGEKLTPLEETLLSDLEYDATVGKKNE